MPENAIPPRDWGEAFAALPLEQPPSDRWPRVSPQLSRKRPARWPGWLAIAAAVALAVVVPLQWRRAHAPTPPATHARASADPLEPLYAESAQLEALLAMARDGRVSSGTAAELAGELDQRLARIDRALAAPGLDPAAQLALWHQRIDTLRAMATFEGTRRWLAAQGERYDGALVRVD